jgi:hypothetical protein
MNGPIHEMILVTLAAQAGLDGDDSAMARLWPDHPALQYTQLVNFAEPADAERELVLAQDPPEWLQLLRANGVTSVKVAHGVQTDGPMDRMTSGFVGGGRRWLIHTSSGDSHDSWLPRLALDHEERQRMIKMRDRNAKIWRSSYLRQDEASHGPFDADLDGAAAALEAALGDIIAFAAAQKVIAWVETAFEPALWILQGRRGVDLDHSRLDFKPFARDPRAARLLNAVMPAWVFGGMGSWNDQVFEDREEYERVSGALYAAVHRAIAAAVNGSADAAPGA